MKHRRSLTHVGGEVETAGDERIAAALQGALDVPPAARPRVSRQEDADDPDRVHVHGFHTYPARMHPLTAARLVRGLSSAGATVLDPFCGSGTVLVEAMMAGRRAVGRDLNPLAVWLARMKATPSTEAARESLRRNARTVAAFADDRRARRAGASHRYPPEDVATFEPHVLLELDSLRMGIAEISGGDEATRTALLLVLSAILVKVSRKTSDTSAVLAPRRIAAGYTATLFARKADDLARRLGAFGSHLPTDSPPVSVELDDASRLRTVGASTVDAVVTSPPYVATYDYLAHHALRLRWLGLDARSFSSGEMGSRRRYAAMNPADAAQAWSRELTGVLRALSRVCRQGARVAMLLADSAVGGHALRADAIVAELAPQTGFVPLARASQQRPHFHAPSAHAFRARPRVEHALVIEKR